MWRRRMLILIAIERRPLRGPRHRASVNDCCVRRTVPFVDINCSHWVAFKFSGSMLYIRQVMKHILLALTILLFSSAAYAQHAHAGAADAKPMSLMVGLGDVHHPVSTTNAEAQRFFDQGLALVYGFNHDEAVRSF